MIKPQPQHNHMIEESENGRVKKGCLQFNIVLNKRIRQRWKNCAMIQYDSLNSLIVVNVGMQK